MRYLFAALCVAVLFAGLLFGALNPEPVQVDLYLRAFELRLGAALLIAVLVGALVGGFCAALALSLQARRRRRRAPAAAAGTALVPAGGEGE
jgi:lipopolysaccharide assembly protein A